MTLSTLMLFIPQRTTGQWHGASRSCAARRRLLSVGVCALLAGLIVLTASGPAAAFSDGITTLSFGAGGCAECHSGGAAYASIYGRTKVLPGSVHAYRLYPGSHRGQYGGFNISAPDGILGVGGLRTKGTQALPGTGGRLEVTHSVPKRSKLGNYSSSFQWTAPASFSSVDFAGWVTAGNNDGTTAGDDVGPASFTVESGAALCPPSPGVCVAPGKSVLKMKDEPGKQAVLFKWAEGPTTDPHDFGAPPAYFPNIYALCLYADSTLVAEMLAEQFFNGWEATGDGFQFNDTDSSLQKVRLKALPEPGNAVVMLKGKGAVGLPSTLPFAAATSVTAQVINDQNSNCWGDVYSGDEIGKNEATVFAAAARNQP